jgi:hypothetical protein
MSISVNLESEKIPLVVPISQEDPSIRLAEARSVRPKPPGGVKARSSKIRPERLQWRGTLEETDDRRRRR